MAAKEWLEDIKERFVKYEYDYNLNGEDVEWLIQQAERVQELESESYNAHLERLLDRREQQIKRYREALEFYADRKTYERRHDPYEPLDTDINDDRGEKARKALEGD